MAVAIPKMEQIIYELHFDAYRRTVTGPYTTGRLALSLKRIGPIVTGNRVTGRVGSNLPYAASVQSGAAPHTFGARGNHRLRFYWRKVGRVVYPWYVKHPGQKGKRFLVDPLFDVARRHNMTVIVTEF